MKKALAGVAVILALTACGGTDEPKATDEEFLAAVGELEGDYTDESLVKLGKSICSAFARGNDLTEVLVTMTDSGMSESDAGDMVVAATTTYCPED